MTRREIMTDADVEVLFQSKTISDIKKINSDLERDIDKKREELRTTVGERYRDLMEAAETITHMEITSLEVVEAFKNIAETTAKFDYYHAPPNMKYGSEANMYESEAQHKEETFDTSDLAIAAEIKLLMDSPEIMWSAVDDGDFLTAAQVFLFARHIHTNISLQANSESAKKISTAFPIVERQWSSILPFYDTILNGCTQLISDESLLSSFELISEEKWLEQLSTSKVIRSMAAITLLKGTNMKNLFKEFLTLRENTIKKNIFTQEHGAKFHIRSTIRSLIFCIQSCAAFLPADNGKETIESVLKQISEKPAIGLFHNVSVSPVMKYLPSIIKDFCPSVVKKDVQAPRINATNALDKDFLKMECTSWLDRVHDMISEGTSKVLSHVNTLSGISMIRKNVYEFLAFTTSYTNCSLSIENWKTVCFHVLDRNVNIWDEFYRNIFRDRVEELILREIDVAVNFLSSKLLLPIDMKNVAGADEFNWSEPSINEITLDQNHMKEKKRNLTTLELKARSYTPLVQGICQRFDDLLKALISELSNYVNCEDNDRKNNSVDSSKTSNSFLESTSRDHSSEEDKPFLLQQDNVAILEFVENSISKAITKMLEKVDLELHQEIKCGFDENKFDERYVVMARICQAIPELSLYLEKCACASSQVLQRNSTENYWSNDYLGELKSLGDRSSKSANDRQTKLKEINEKFLDTCNFLLISWIDCLGILLKTRLKASLANTYEANLNLLPQWEAVEISEEGEDGKQIKSTIRVPSQISVGLYQVLYQHVSSIYSIGSHNLPYKVQEVITLKTSKLTSDVYKNLFCIHDEATNKDVVKITQNVALQLHFDVQFITQCMASRENEEVSSMCQQALDSIERHIDPFDLSVFNPYMSTNVKRCVLKYQAVFGIIIPVDKYTLLTSMKATLPQVPSPSSLQLGGAAIGSTQPSECAIQLSNSTTRFPILPLANKKAESSRTGSRLTNRTVPTGAIGMTQDSSMVKNDQRRTKTDRGEASQPETTNKSRKRDKSPVNKAWSAFEEMSNKWFGTGK